MNEPQRGEIVLIRSTDEDGAPALQYRRIIALPGEQVRISDGRIYINGTECTEEYYSGATESELKNFIVNEGTYFVLGDNREEACDSRQTGSIKRSDIVSRVSYIFGQVGGFEPLIRPLEAINYVSLDPNSIGDTLVTFIENKLR